MKSSEKRTKRAVKNFVTRHPGMTVFIIILTLAAAGMAIFTLLGLVANAQAAGLVPAILGEWTVGYFITFILHLVFWELLLVGTWAIPISLIIYGAWYRMLPSRERREYEGGHRKKSAGEGGGISFFIWLVWLLIVWVDGKWNLAFQSWAFNDWIHTWLGACLWVLLVAGILGLMYVAWCVAGKER